MTYELHGLLIAERLISRINKSMLTSRIVHNLPKMYIHYLDSWIVWPAYAGYTAHSSENRIYTLPSHESFGLPLLDVSLLPKLYIHNSEIWIVQQWQAKRFKCLHHVDASFSTFESYGLPQLNDSNLWIMYVQLWELRDVQQWQAIRFKSRKICIY